MKNKQNKNRTIGLGRRLLLQKNSPFAAVEAYKTLRTNLIFSLPGAGCKCIGITSAESGEGKSTNSINLAISFSQIGKKVLLIDADMRLPTIAYKLRVKSRPGLSDVLIGEVQPEKAIQKLKDQGIDVLPVGTIPPDPTGLLESEQIEQFLSQLKTLYDYIFIDLPPSNTVTDALILSRLVDGFLLVIKHNATTYRSVGEVINKFHLINGNILGFVYTNASLDRSCYKKYYKNYRYGKEKHSAYKIEEE